MFCNRKNRKVNAPLLSFLKYSIKFLYKRKKLLAHVIACLSNFLTPHLLPHKIAVGLKRKFICRISYIYAIKKYIYLLIKIFFFTVKMCRRENKFYSSFLFTFFSFAKKNNNKISGRLIHFQRL